MIAKISILISIVVSTINVILLMRLYQEEYDDDEELYHWVITIKNKDGKVIFFEGVMAKTSEEAIAFARAMAGVVEGDGHKANCEGPFE